MYIFTFVIENWHLNIKGVLCKILILAESFLELYNDGAEWFQIFSTTLQVSISSEVTLALITSSGDHGNHPRSDLQNNVLCHILTGNIFFQDTYFQFCTPACTDHPKTCWSRSWDRRLLQKSTPSTNSEWCRWKMCRSEHISRTVQCFQLFSPCMPTAQVTEAVRSLCQHHSELMAWATKSPSGFQN